MLKNGNSFAVLDAYGNAQAEGPAAEGLFFEDTRYLSRLVMTIDGKQPELLSSTVTEGNTMLAADLANPDLVADGRPRVPAATIHIRNSIVLGEDALFAVAELTNFGTSPAQLALEVEIEADFADIFEVRGTVRARRGTMLPVEREAAGPVLSYRGLDGVTRRTRVAFDPAPQMTPPARAVWTISLAPGAREAVQFAVHCNHDGRPPSRSSRAQILAAEQKFRSERRARVAEIRTSNPAFDEWLQCSRADLEMLITETPQGLYPYAGVPWFSAAFGRDGLITAFECLWLDPDLAAGTLRFLAANQATAANAKIDAEPGKILHETRRGEMAALGEVPFGRYYGSIDSTPLFVMLAAAYHARTGDLELIRVLWPNIEAAVAWMSGYGDTDGDGLIEYRRKAENGLDNQGWKDSHDAIFYEDGRLAEPPIALVEVQAYAYAAYAGAASLAEALGLDRRAAELAAAARHVQQRFEAAFWLDELGTYAMALDGAKRPCRVRSSNAGHALFAGIAQPDRAARVCGTLMAEGSFSGWGVRTIAQVERRFNPMSYHNGSVWPHDNALIALGFARYGHKEPLLSMLRGWFDAASFFEFKRLPELFCGFARQPDLGPTPYPLACAPQAWSAGSAFALLGAALGVSFAPRQRQICFTRPVLPSWLDEVRLANLRLGEASVDLTLRRGRGDPADVAIDVARRDGPVDIVLAH